MSKEMEAFLRFLRGSLKHSELMIYATDVLAPLFELARSGRYELPRFEDLREMRPERVSDAIASLTGHSASGIELVSIRGPEEVWNFSCREMGEEPSGHFWRTVKAWFHVRRTWKLDFYLRRYLLDDLEANLEETLSDLDEEKISLAKVSLEFGLLSFLDPLLADEAGRAGCAVPFLQCLPTAIPLGESKTEPGTWFILVG